MHSNTRKLILLLFIIGFPVFYLCSSKPNTIINVSGQDWYVNNHITCPNTPAEGLLLNVRMVNATFEDTNNPDFNPEVNLQTFLQKIDEYKNAGVSAITFNLQGGMPGYEGAVNSAFSPDGSLQEHYLKRMKKVINACDRAGMAVILGCYYQRQDQILENEKAVRTGIVNTINWISKNGWKHVMLEIANEYPHRGFDFDIIKSAQGMAELIKLAKETNPDLLVSASGLGNGRVDSLVAKAADFILIHFNSTPVEEISNRIQALKKYHKPIVCNEDDKVGFEAAHALLASVKEGCSWGYMNKNVNQYKPFEFNGVQDDKDVYNTMHDLTSSAKTTGTTVTENSVLKELELYVSETLANLSPCSAGIIVSKDGNIIYEKYLHGSEPQKPYTDINEHSMWPMWSCTKSFISALLINLDHDGLLALDDSVSKYLPEFTNPGNGPFSRKDITIRHLASHTSGAGVTGKKLNELIYDPPLDLNLVDIQTKPGEVFLYSSLGMHILERVIEAATGEDMYESLKKRILDPLGIKNARYIYKYNPELPLLPCIAGDFANVSDHYSTVIKGQRAHTGLYLTAKELNIFSQLFLSDGTVNGHTFFHP